MTKNQKIPHNFLFFTTEVVKKNWPGTNIPINDMDRSRINAISMASFTGDQTIDFNTLNIFSNFKDIKLWIFN